MPFCWFCHDVAHVCCRYSANDGARPYYLNTFSSGEAIAAVHEHANYDRTVGLGEFVAVMNGVEFRTRHNDYKLRMPSPHDKGYYKMEDIPFPDVPPSVLSKHTVAEQTAEMRKFFEAFHKQDNHIRNYEPYFKPALCYLGGAWTLDTKTLSEPFHSDATSSTLPVGLTCKRKSAIPHIQLVKVTLRTTRSFLLQSPM